MYVITKWCKAITASGKDEFTHKSHEGMPFKFRCLDDDGEMCFYGYSSSCDDEEAFAPLDETGESYGCVAIEYRNVKENGNNCKRLGTMHKINLQTLCIVPIYKQGELW